MYYTTDYNSPIGKILLVSDEINLCGLYFYNQKHFPSYDKVTKKDDLEIFKKTKQFLDDYFKGIKPKNNINLKTNGTDFQIKVWKILSNIPYGESITYGEIASKISPTMSSQAVGNAVGKNPISILIPCHRVLGANRKLTGYAAGIDKKIKLLNIEKIKYTK